MTPPRGRPESRIAGRARRPILIALAAQAAGGGLAFGLPLALGLGPPVAAGLALQGAIAAVIGDRLGLARWWIPLHLGLPPGAGLLLWLGVPTWVYAIAFSGLILVYWNSAGERVPLYLAGPATWAALAGRLPAATPFAFVDLGSGLGGTLLALARRYPEGRFVGVESAPVPYVLGRLRLRFSGLGNVRLRYGDLWAEDLSAYDVVYCFLSPQPMPALYRKAVAEMRRGSLFISNEFPVPGAPADEVIAVRGRRRTRLHVWRM